MWYKLKRILIYPDGVTEKQVRPKKLYEYSYDFRGKTKSQVTADWWQAWSWDAWTWCWADWLYATTNPWRLIRQFDVNMSNVKKITMTCQIKRWSSIWCTRWICTDTSRANPTSSFFDTTPSSSNFIISGTATNISPTYSWTTLKWRYELDFVNKIATFKILEWATLATQTKSITDTQISTIRNNPVYWMILVWPNWVNTYMQTVSIQII